MSREVCRLLLRRGVLEPCEALSEAVQPTEGGQPRALCLRGSMVLYHRSRSSRSQLVRFCPFCGSSLAQAELFDDARG